MKHLLPLLCPLLAVPFIALLLMSLDYTFGEAAVLAAMFLPGLFALHYFLPQISFDNRRQGAFQLFFLLCAVVIFEFLALMLTNHYLQYNAEIYLYDQRIPDILQNPLFILLLLLAFAAPSIWLEHRLQPTNIRDPHIEFISDRRRRRLDTSSILYIESNDSEVRIHTLDGASYRTKTKISQWESQLDDRFLRIHRAYIINTERIESHSAGTVTIADRRLDVSRKYRDAFRRLMELRRVAAPDKKAE